MITEKQYLRACGAILKKEPDLDANELFTKVAAKLKCTFMEVCNIGIMMELNEAIAGFAKEEKSK